MSLTQNGRKLHGLTSVNSRKSCSNPPVLSNNGARRGDEDARSDDSVDLYPELTVEWAGVQQPVAGCIPALLVDTEAQKLESAGVRRRVARGIGQ